MLHRITGLDPDLEGPSPRCVWVADAMWYFDAVGPAAFGFCIVFLRWWATMGMTLTIDIEHFL